MKKMFLWIFCLLLCYPLSGLTEHTNQTLFFEEDDVLTCVAAFQNDLYLLTYEGIFQYDLQSGIPSLVTNEVTGDYHDEHCADQICATDSGLYAIQYASQTALQILDEAGCVSIKKLVQFNTEEEISILGAAMTHQNLCLLERGNTGTQLRWLNLTTDAKHQQKLDDAVCMAAYGDSVAYGTKTIKRGVTEHSIAILDLVSGEGKTLFTTSLPVHSLCSMESDLYFASGNKIYRLKQGEQEPSEMAMIPSGDIVACAAFGDQVAVVIDNSLAIRSMNQAAQQTVLTIFQPTGRSADYQAFLSAHPEIELSFVGSAAAEDSFIQDMLTRKKTTDIYQLTDISILRSISQKGIGQDLAISPVITSVVQDMYPAFADIFSADGYIWAVPSTCYLTVPGYNQDFFEQFELPVPTTIMELLELAEKWLWDYANDHPEARFDPFSNGLTLDAILRQYEVEKEIAGQILSFSDEDLADIISKYQTLERLYQQSTRSYRTEISAFNTLDLPHNAQYQPLLLPIQKDAQAVISNAYLEIEFYVVNPYSEHMDEAIAFLESVCASWDGPTQTLLLRSCDQPIESPTYQSDSMELSEKIQEVEKMLQTAEGETHEILQAELASLRQEMEILQINRWIVTETEIAFYKEIVHNIVLKMDDPLNELEEQIMASYQQMQNGRINAAEFLRALDTKVQMVLLEMGD